MRIFFLLAANVVAFSSLPKRNVARRRTKTTQTTMVAPAVASLVPAARVVASVPVLYGLMSMNEYVTHRYYQHAEFNKSPFLRAIARVLLMPFGKKVPMIRGGGHVEHHAETLDDMTLKTDPKWRSTTVAKSLDEDTHRGTAFTWEVAALMTIQMLPTTIPVFKYLLGFSLPATMAILLPGMALHTLVWNALHPNMHALPDVTFSQGPPSSVFAGLRNTWYFRFLYSNHEGHHIAGGRANYNVACPGMDHLVGTFMPEKDWRPRSKTTYASHHGEDVDFDQQIKNHIAREKFGIKSEPPTLGSQKLQEVKANKEEAVLELENA